VRALVKWTKGKVAGAAISLIVSVIIGPLLVYEYTSRPIIDYKLDSYEYYNFHFGSETVNLEVCNRGGIDADVWLILTVENATIVEPESKPYIQYNETETRVLILCRKGAEEMKRGYSLKILPDGDPQTIVLKYAVEKVFNWGSIFWEPNPIYPVTLTYNRTNTMEYRRIQ
jgi:hypothetical protein